MATEQHDLADTVALITGAASGIGAAVAERLAGRGAAVALVDRDADAVRAQAARVRGLGVVADVSDPEAIAAAIDTTTRELGRLDLVYLNAGRTGRQTGLQDGLDVGNYRQLIGVNVDQIVFGVSSAAPVLRQRGGGTIVATASLAGLVPMPTDPLYTLTKHAVVGYVRAVAEPLAADGIRVLALCPGFTDTPLIADARPAFEGFPLLGAEDVADAFEAALADGKAGEAWFVQPGRPPGPYRFHGVPGPATGQAPPDLSAAPH